MILHSWLNSLRTRTKHRKTQRESRFAGPIEICEQRCLLSGDEATFVVTTLIDENDSGLGEGSGDSLREVVTAANADPGLDVIKFDASLFPGGTQTMTLLHGQLNVYGETRLIGPSRDTLWIDAQSLS